MQMQDMSNPLTATKGTPISLLAGTHSQGGTASNVRANEWEEFQLPISFPHTVVEHLVSALSRNATVAVTGATTGHSDKDYFQIANSQANSLVRWLAIGI